MRAGGLIVAADEKGFCGCGNPYAGKILSANDVIPIELNLNVSPTISGITDFSFNIAITKTG